MAITRDGDALVITGDPAALNVFSGNIKKFAAGPVATNVAMRALPSMMRSRSG